jgi:hypothetical protein
MRSHKRIQDSGWAWARLQRPLAVSALPVGAVSRILVEGLGAIPAVRVGHSSLCEARRVNIAPEVAVDSLPAVLPCLGDRGLLLVLRHVEHELARAWVDQCAALNRVLQRVLGHVAVAVARSLALILD